MNVKRNVSLHPQTVQDAERLAAEAKRARRKKPVRRKPSAVISQEDFRVDREVLEVALKLADGDHGRLELCKDGSVIVHNSRELRWQKSWES